MEMAVANAPWPLPCVAMGSLAQGDKQKGVPASGKVTAPHRVDEMATNTPQAFLTTVFSQVDCLLLSG